MQTPENTPLVAVEWEDIQFDDNWDGAGGPGMHPVEVKSVGYLLRETATEIEIGASYNYQEQEWATKHIFSKVVPNIIVLKGAQDEAE